MLGALQTKNVRSLRASNQRVASRSLTVKPMAFFTSKEAPSAPPKEKQLERVAEQFNRWNAALQTGDAKTVASLYAPDGILLPTISNKVRTTPLEIEDYFKNFLQLKPQGKIDECNVRFLSPDSAINSGVYTFNIVKNGVPAKVQARYSFTYKKIGDDWFIADHHSSGMPEPAEDKEEKEIMAQFDKWNAALATLDPKKVADLYAPHAVLLPTVSNKVRTTKAEIEDYFTSFLQLKPQGKIDEFNIRYLTPDLAINSGVYTFDIVKDGQPTKVQARYSFTYTKASGDWLIVDHHSSAMPESEENTRKEIASQFLRWNNALASGDPKKVAELYAPDAVLLPTVSNKVRTSPAEIEDYFVNFLQLKPQGKIDESNIRLLAPDTAINSGVYTFDLVKEGAPVQVQARYSFTYKKVGGSWKIIDHHSSGMPEPVKKEAEVKVEERVVAMA